MSGTEAQPVADQVEEVRERLPGTLRQVVDGTARHQTPVLAAGSPSSASCRWRPRPASCSGCCAWLPPTGSSRPLVDTLQHSFPETLGLGALLEQMQDRAGRYAGVSLLVLLWPATTLASGWRRALDAVCERDTAVAVPGLVGRVKGLALGLLLLAGLLVLVTAMIATTVMAGQRTVLLGTVAVAAVALQFGFSLAIYRLLPQEAVPCSRLWPGAAWSTLGVCAVTAALAVALTAADQFAQQYPPALSTAVVLGAWLYGANLSLLLGGRAEHRSADGAPAAAGAPGNLTVS